MSSSSGSGPYGTGSSASTNRGRLARPPPRKSTAAGGEAAGASTATSAASTTASGPRKTTAATAATAAARSRRAREAYGRTSRASDGSSTAASSSVGSTGVSSSRSSARRNGAAAAAKGATGTTSLAASGSSSSTTGTAKDRSARLSGAARKAPVASRPVGSYYSSSPAPMAVPTAEGNNPNGSGSGNIYSNSNTSDENENDAWEDWGSPAPKPAADSADPAKTAATTNDWYSAPVTTSSPYTSTGFAASDQSQQQSQNHQIPMQPGSGFYQPSSAVQQQQQQPLLSGAMDVSAHTMSAGGATTSATTSAGATPSFSMFMPSAFAQAPGENAAASHGNAYAPSIEDEAPLLEELGINVDHILLKMKTVVLPFSRFGGNQIDPAAICKEADLPGAIALLFLLGGEMVLTGKLRFGYIYVYGLLGCIAMTLVANLISPTEAISFWTVTSIMGYSLLPVNILALVKIFVINLVHLNTLGNILGALTVAWSTMASTRLMELGCGLRDQRYLIMYPLLLFYSAFVLMTIF